MFCLICSGIKDLEIQTLFDQPKIQCSKDPIYINSLGYNKVTTVIEEKVLVFTVCMHYWFTQSLQKL